MLDDEDPDGLALARRIALDVRQLVKQRGDMGAATALVVRRLGITDTAQLAARTREATVCIVPTQTSGSAVRDVRYWPVATFCTAA